MKILPLITAYSWSAPTGRDIFRPDTKKYGMPFCKVQRKFKKIKKAMADKSKKKNRK